MWCGASTQRAYVIAGRDRRRTRRLAAASPALIWHACRVRVSAKADYAVRAAIELVGAHHGNPTKGDVIAQAQRIPLTFLACQVFQ